MFGRFLFCISQLWDILCDCMASTTSQTPSTSASITSQTPSTTAPHLMASTTSQIPLSSTSPPTSWDVFLSFRGVDTRYKFTSHLYSALDRYGIRTYRDDPELRTGEVISDALIKAIKESKTYVVVLSENYASSSWCLDELVEILNCHKTMQRLVIPVFYNIDPSVARHQIGSFKEAFEKYETRFVGEREKVKKWRDALTEVANFSGKHISQNRSEADFINEIVDEIVLEINPKTLDVASYPVGLDSRVKAITAMISSATEGVIKIGIYGMGGIGKTTLAKALFNQLLLGGSFKGSCFLANVREISGTLKGPVTLQEQLVNDVLKSTKKVEIRSVDQGTTLIRARICSTKILLVIDDLDDHKQFESLVGPFASGSVVILTTRDQEILEKIEVETKYRYMVNELDDAQSLALFSQHAFGDTKPNNTLMVLCKDILRHAGGLPLALEVFGSYLYKRSEVGWKYYIKKLERVPNSTIQQRLIISLDALEWDDSMLKKIFLDISCVFIGMKKKRVVEILKTYYSDTDHYIDTLKKRCLLTINHEDELRMHDLLQDMGREIARNNSRDEPGKHSRLWVSKEICDVLKKQEDVLKKQEGTEAIEVIMPPYFDYEWSEVSVNMESFRMESFEKMSKLRFLYLNGVNLTGNFGQALEDLRWFSWNHCPLKCLPSEFYPKKLVILELCRSKLRTMWELNMVSHVFEKLKTLDMSSSKDLTTPPDFTRFPRLVSLDLSGCEKLRSLPDTICNLRALRSLNIDYCSGLEALPIELGNIESLTKLLASAINVSKLPDSLGRLTNLVTLDLQYNKNLETLPDTICNLRSLQKLILVGCRHLLSIPELPPSLKILNAEGCKSMERLLNLSNLKQLEELDLTDCSGLTEIRGLEELTSIRRLQFGGCDSSILAYTFTKLLFQIYSGFGHQIFIESKKFPDWISQSSDQHRFTTSLDLLPNVSHNYLGMILCFKSHRGFHVSVIDYCIESSTSIFRGRVSEFKLFDNSFMVTVPRSIFSVTDGDDTIKVTVDENAHAYIVGIHLLYKQETTMSDEYDNTKFKELELAGPELQDIFLDIACFFVGWKEEEVVKILETCYSSVNHYIGILKQRCLLTISSSDRLEMQVLLQQIGRKIARNNYRDEPGKHSRLWLSVDIYDVLKMHKGTELIEGIIPRKVNYRDALTGESFTAETFKKMSKLRFLYLENFNLTGSFEQTFEDLRWLRWDRCPFRCLPSDFYPQKLVILELPHSNIITMWEPNMDSHVFEELKTLNMSYSQDLTSTPDFTKMPYLETLNLEGCESLKEVHISIGSLLRLVSLDLRGCVKLRSLPDTICKLRTLNVLTIDNCTSLEALPIELGNIESLTKLNAYGLTVLELPNSIRRLSKLVELNLRDNKYLKNLSHIICNLRALEVLDIIGCSNLDSLPTELGNIKSLRELNAGKLTVSKLPNSIGHLSKLVKLRLSSNKDLETLPKTICNLISLEILDISGCEKLAIIPDYLWKITRLRELNAGGATLLKILPDIESSQIELSLQKLDLSKSGLTALPFGVSQLSNLEYLELHDCCDLLSIAELPPNLKCINAHGCTSMERLPNLSNLKQLEELDLSDCSCLKEIQGLEEFTSIRKLILGGCNYSLSLTKVYIRYI